MIKRTLLLLLVFAAPTVAQIAMPDPSVINGKALPAGELQTGTITVRVVRESIGNNIVGQQVDVTVNGETRKAVTDEQGRAEFKGLPAGANGHADATVDGERLQSDPFVVPSSGGLRVILVAGIKQAEERKKKEEAEAAAAPPVKGTVVLGGIHMSTIPSFDYALIYGERVLRSVANNTRADGREFLAEAASIPVRTHVQTFAFTEANEALGALKKDAIRGAGVLMLS